MKKRTVLIVLAAVVMVAALVPLSGAVAGFLPQPQAQQPGWEEEGAILRPAQQGQPIPDLSTLLDYPYPVTITRLTGPDAIVARDMLLGRPETVELMAAMLAKGFDFRPESAEVMRIDTEVLSPDGTQRPVVITGMTMTSVENELSAALTAMVDDGDRGFFQAHHTNLDPQLAQIPDPPIIVNGMPYFYITTLRWINGQIVTWRYWWYDSHHHPNWYYAHYYWYWRYYWWYRVDWPYWYWWGYGWYYWRYWYYWSTWFPY
jgi:hypothetical protein